MTIVPGTPHVEAISGADKQCDATSLLEALHRPGECVSVCHDPGDGFRLHRIAAAGDDEQAAVAEVADHDVWHSVNPLRRDLATGRGKAADVARLAALVIDIDCYGGKATREQASNVIDMLTSILKARPCVVDTVGGLHLYWLLDDDEHLDGLHLDDGKRAAAKALLARWKALVVMIASAAGCEVDRVFDLSRVMRTPGTYNTDRKGRHGPGPVVEVQMSTDTLDVATLTKRLDVALAGQEDEDKSSSAPQGCSQPKRVSAALAPGQPGTPWGLATLDAICEEISTLPAGDRNTRMNRLAFKVWQVVGGGQLDKDHACAALTAAGLASGHDPKNVEATVRSARKGIEYPRSPETRAEGITVSMAGKGSPAADAVVSGQAVPDPPADSFESVDLSDLVAQAEAGTLTIEPPTVGVVGKGPSGLFYEASTNALAGESTTGKTWMALTIGVEQMMMGRHFWFVDFEDTPTKAVLRLVSDLGCPGRLLHGSDARFHYEKTKDGPATAVRGLLERVRASGRPGAPPYVVVDSIGEHMAVLGLDQDDDEAVVTYHRLFARPMAWGSGATVVLLDHMTKTNDDGRSRYSRGSGRKRDILTGSMYVVEERDPFDRETDGYVALRVSKDRNGFRAVKDVASYVDFAHSLAKAEASDDLIVLEHSDQLSVTFRVGKDSATEKIDREERRKNDKEAKVVALVQAVQGLAPDQRTGPKAGEALRAKGMRFAQADLAEAVRRVKAVAGT